MKYKFLYDNIREGDIVGVKEQFGSFMFEIVGKVHCHCNPDVWSEHFHTGHRICEYDDNHSWSDIVSSIWRYENASTLKRVAVKHPKTLIWESKENMLENRVDVSSLIRAKKEIEEFIKNNSEVLADD